MNVPLLDLRAQYQSIRAEVMAALEAVCDEQAFILGARVADLEKDIQKYVGVSQAVGVASGTDAILLALMACGVGAGDEVVTVPYTFFATAGSISRLGEAGVRRHQAGHLQHGSRAARRGRFVEGQGP